MPLQRPAVEELLTQSGWLRRLAGSLVAGEAAADDLVQETWLAALRHPPEDRRSPRPWLARIARNLAANFRRGEARRKDHERASAPTQPDFDPARAAEAVELQRLLAEAVLRLDEPLRVAVVLRYVRGLDSRASGELLGTPPGTVRWRLKRALEALRADLDQRFGDRERWCSALVLLRPIAPAASTATPRTPLASSSLTLASTLASATLGVALVAAWVSSDPREGKAPSPSLAALALAPDTHPEELLPAAPIETAPAVPAPRITRSRVSPSTPPHSPRALRAPIHGELRIANPALRRDASGNLSRSPGSTEPVDLEAELAREPALDEVLTIHLRAGDLSVSETVVSAPDGTFHTRTAFPRGFVLAEVLRPAGDVAVDHESLFDPAASQRWSVRVPWPTFVRGRLVDGTGAPLADVDVFASRPGFRRPELVQTDREGRFQLTCRNETQELVFARGFEHARRIVGVARGPNDLGDTVVPFGGGGELLVRLRTREEPLVTLLLTDLARGISMARVPGVDSEDPAELRFPDLPPGEYRLDVLAHDGRRYEPDSLELSAPARPVELRAQGARERFVLRARGADGPLDAYAFVLVRGRWLEAECTFALADVERWVLLARDHRPATGVPPESGPLEVVLEPGWGGALHFVDASATSSHALGPPLAGVVVLAEGVPVATSDSTGLALVSLPVQPDLEQGWREEHVWSGAASPIFELLRD